MGGALIRRLIHDLRRSGLSLPLSGSLDSQILIACSGGLDSTALAVLIARYGTRVAPVSSLALLHVDHGWRGPESRADAQRVEQLALRLGVPCLVETLDPSVRPAGSSLEEWGRQERKRIYQKYGEQGFRILTGHQADELCETLLWRLFTGAATTHGAGILIREGYEIRPLLGCQKSELRTFLEEEAEVWSEDPTNQDPSLLRGGMRQSLVPVLTRLFPRWKSHLLQGRTAEVASRASPEASDSETEVLDWMNQWFGQAGVRTRRSHWQTIQKWLGWLRTPDPSVPADSDRTLCLQSGWRVRFERACSDQSARVVIERDSTGH